MEIGERFGRLVTIKELSERNHGHVMWECKCDCGNITKVQRDRLLNGHTKSCGCGKIKHFNITKGKDLTGKRIGRLVVKEWLGTDIRSKNKQSIYRCECDCGNIKNISRSDLMSGRVFSCGCYAIEIRTKHNGYRDRLYNIWSAMRDRCNNSNHPSYYAYGGRGIKVCDEWDDYKIFKDWAMKNGYNPDAEFQECTIDRVDNDGNYEPNNCRFVNFDVQSNNRQNTIRIEMDGNIKSLKQWCDELNCDYNKTYKRKVAGKDIRDWFNCELPYKVVRVV